MAPAAEAATMAAATATPTTVRLLVFAVYEFMILIGSVADELRGNGERNAGES